MKYSILLVANYKSDVGFAWWLMENFWSQIATQFTNNNITCLLIYPELNDVPYIIKKSPIKIIKARYSNKNFFDILNIIKIIKKYNVRYIYLTDKSYYDWIYCLFRLLGVKKIINHDHTPGERYLEYAAIKNKIKKTIHKLNLVTCDHYICVSKFVMNRAININFAPINKCSVLYNGIRLFSNERTDYANKIFNIPLGSKIVVSTGRATYYKGIDNIIKCANNLILEKNYSSIYFLHIGSGPDLEKFKKKIKKINLENKFIFAGYRKDVKKILTSCHIGIQFSIGEAFSLSILEYLQAGLITFVPNNCGNSEVIKDGINGFLFKPNDVSDAASKIEFALSNYSLLNEIACNAKNTIKNRFSIEKCNEKFLDIINENFFENEKFNKN